MSAVLVKICGFTEPEDVRKACTLGADMVGVILVEGSPRYVEVEKARELLAEARGAASVAVLMPRGVQEVRAVFRELEPDYLQLHPSITPSELARVRRELGARVIGVLPVPAEGARLEEILLQARQLAAAVDILLLDTKGPAGGGTGRTHDWRVSRAVREEVGTPLFLAGGLTPANVAEAIRVVSPEGVDVASGVERSPGKKDPRLMEEFIRRAKEGEE